MPSKEFLKVVRDKQVRALKDISNDVYQLSLTTKSTKMEDEKKFQANLVQGAFYITGISIAAQAFNQMITEKQTDPECTNEQLYYFEKIVKDMIEKNRIKMREMENENK